MCILNRQSAWPKFHRCHPRKTYLRLTLLIGIVLIFTHNFLRHEIWSRNMFSRLFLKWTTDSKSKVVSKLWLDLCGGGFIHLFNFNSTCNPLHLVCFYTRAKRLSKVKSLISQIRWKIFFSEKCLVTLPAAYSGPSTVRKCVSGYIPIGQVSSFTINQRWLIVD